MGEVLEEIRSGTFAKEWSTDREGKLALLEKVKEIRATHPMTVYENDARRAFRIGDAAEGS